MSLESQLSTLERAELIRVAQSLPEPEYLFRHAMVQEAAYSSLLKSTRRDLHRAIGETIERLYPDRLDELAPVLARHFQEAELHSKAIVYYARAGDQAAERYANGEALMHYDCVMALLGNDELPPGVSLERIYLRRGRALEMLGRYPEADANYVAMEQLATKHNDRALELAAVNARGTIHSAPTPLADPARAREFEERALALALALGDRAAESKALWNHALALKFSGDPRGSVAAGERSAAIARELNLREQLALTLNDISSPLLSSGDTERAIAATQEAISIFRALGNLPMLCDSLNNYAEIEWTQGRLEAAEALTAEALEIARSIGNLWGEGYCQMHVAMIASERAEFAAALHALKQAAALARAAGFRFGEQISRMFSGLALAYLGDFPAALSLVQSLLEFDSEGMANAVRSNVLAYAAFMHGKLGDVASARSLAQEAESLLVDVDVQMTAYVLLGLSSAALYAGQPERALQKAREAQAYLERYGFRILMPDALAWQGAALRKLGQLENARAVLLRARDLARTCQSRRGEFIILLDLAPISLQLGTPDADSLRAEARELIAFTAAHAPAELRATFLALPEVQAIVEQGPA